MRPFFFFSTVLSLFSAAAGVAADWTETIGNQDRRISYSDGWNFFPFPTGHGGTLSFIKSSPGTASLKVYNASKIAVSVFVQKSGQRVRISLDNQNHDITPSPSQQPAWTSDSLDPSVPHDIQIIAQNTRGQFTALDSFLVTYPSSPTNATNSLPNQSTSSAGASDSSRLSSLESFSLPQSPTALSQQQPNTEPVLSGGKLAGVIVVCTIVPVLIMGIILYRQRMVRKRKAASTVYYEWMARRPQMPPSQPPPLTPPNEKSSGAETK